MTAKEEAEKYLNTAIQCFKNNDIERTKAYSTKAIEGYSKAIESGVHDKVIYKNRGIAYIGIEDYAKAIEDFTKVIELGLKDKDIYRNRGFAYASIEDYPKAIEDFTKVIEFDENNKDGYENRGVAYLRINDYTKAIEDFTKVIEFDENNTEAYYSCGYAYACIGNYQKAIKDYTKAIDLDASNKGAYADRGCAYACIENYPKAIEDFTKAIELDVNNRVVYRNRGLAYLYKGDYPEAIDDFKEVIKLNKNTGDNDYILNKIKLTDNILNKRKLTNNVLNKIQLTDNIVNLIDDILQNNESNVLPDEESINLIKLVNLCYYLMEEIRINPSDMNGEQFVHYTKAGTLQFLLHKDHTAKLRLNNAVYMNDPEEGQILKRVLCQLDQNNELENLLKDTEDIKNYTYLTCFSPYNKRDELPMWIHYGDGGKGVGLVFNNSFFDKTDLYKVQYIDVKDPDINKLNQNVQEKITAILNILKKDKIKNTDNKEVKNYVNIILNYVSYLFKDKAYEYENEVRILKYRDYDSQDIKTDDVGRDIPKLFIEYDECISNENCVEIIAGPKSQYTEIAAYAKYMGIQKVSQSEIKYR